MHEFSKSMDVSSMAKMFSQMADFLNDMQEKEKKERLSEEFETARIESFKNILNRLLITMARSDCLHI